MFSIDTGELFVPDFENHLADRKLISFRKKTSKEINYCSLKYKFV